MLGDTYRHQGMRKKLVDLQKKKGIEDERVLAAIARVPRHLFLDQAFMEHAYEDKAFRIGAGQTISQPYTVAYQSSLLELSPGIKVLEIGTGSGYQAAVLSRLCQQVYTVERINTLLAAARKAFGSLRYFNIMISLC